MSTANYHWMTWQPGQVIEKAPTSEPSKPSELGFGGFEGCHSGQSSIIEATPHPDGRCWFGHDPYWILEHGAWRCGTCEPGPHDHYLRGVTEASLGNRTIVLQPPAGDLPEPGSWAKTPTGEAAELVLYREDGGEVLTRNLEGGGLAWFEPAALSWEVDWGWNDAQQVSVEPAAAVPGKMCSACRSIRWSGRDGAVHCDCDRPPQGGHAASCTCGRCRRVQ